MLRIERVQQKIDKIHAFIIYLLIDAVSQVEKSMTNCPVCGLVVSNDEYKSHVTACKELKQEQKARAARASG